MNWSAIRLEYTNNIINIIDSLDYYLEKRVFVNLVSDIHDDIHIYQNNTSDLRKNNQNKRSWNVTIEYIKTDTITTNLQYENHFKNVY